MNAIGKKSFQERSSSTFYQSTPPPIPLSLSDSMPEQETGEFQFQWVYGLKPHPPPSSQKNKMLIFGLHSTSGDWLAG